MEVAVNATIELPPVNSHRRKTHRGIDKVKAADD
jgi:hypothetical protein